MLQELDLKFPKEDISDPYVILGYGVNAYYQILESLAKMFFCIFLFTIPLFVIYGSGQHYKVQSSYPISRFFIGNWGATTMMCKSSRVETNVMNIECPAGTVFVGGNKAQVGAISNAFRSYTWCNQAAIDQQISE